MTDVRRLMLIHVTLYAVLASLSSAQIQSDIAAVLPMLGPRAEVDIVGVLDRSHGVGQHNFVHYLVPFFRRLLSQYAAVHPQFARSAVITFARDVTVAYDTVSGAGVTKCELFTATRPLWDRITFNVDPDVANGTNLTGALRYASDILQQGRNSRPNVTQVNPNNHNYNHNHNHNQHLINLL